MTVAGTRLASVAAGSLLTNRRGAQLSATVGTAWLLLAPPVVAFADSAQFEIPSQPMPAALKAFAAQAHVQLLYVYSVVEHVRGNPVQGELDKRAALTQLLRGTGLEAIYVSDTEATVRQVSTPPDTAAGEDADGSQGDRGRPSRNFWFEGGNDGYREHHSLYLRQRGELCDSYKNSLQDQGVHL